MHTRDIEPIVERHEDVCRHQAGDGEAEQVEGVLGALKFGFSKLIKFSKIIKYYLVLI